LAAPLPASHDQRRVAQAPSRCIDVDLGIDSSLTKDANICYNEAYLVDLRSRQSLGPIYSCPRYARFGYSPLKFLVTL
jgi:hypothetical protein